MTTGTRLSIGGAIIAAVTAYVAYLGARSSWQYYLTVDECVADDISLVGRPVRVTGHVVPGSLEIQPDRRRATFALDGSNRQLLATCVGPLPDNLAADMDVVVEGRLDRDCVLQGDRVLTRCASKYRSKESDEGDPSSVNTALVDRPEEVR